MQLKQIFFEKENINNEYVDYEKGIMPRMDFANDKLKKYFEDNKEKIMTLVIELLNEYLNDEGFCNDDMFPRPKDMTGEWYVGEISMDEDYFLVGTRFIGTELGKKDDYLGLDVCFFYDKESENWMLDGINSASI